MPTDYEIGLLVGLLIGEGHFGGDGRQPQITLRMHTRHEALFRWLEHTFPGGKLYGPYSHGGRDYYQWMVRGRYLRDELMPLLAPRLSPDLDAHSFDRFAAMQERYQSKAGDRRRAARSSPPPAPLPPRAESPPEALPSAAAAPRPAPSSELAPEPATLPGRRPTPPAANSPSQPDLATAALRQLRTGEPPVHSPSPESEIPPPDSA